MVLWAAFLLLYVLAYSESIDLNQCGAHRSMDFKLSVSSRRNQTGHWIAQRPAEDAPVSIKSFFGHCYPPFDFLAAAHVTAYSTSQAMLQHKGYNVTDVQNIGPWNLDIDHTSSSCEGVETITIIAIVTAFHLQSASWSSGRMFEYDCFVRNGESVTSIRRAILKNKSPGPQHRVRTPENFQSDKRYCAAQAALLEDIQLLLESAIVRYFKRYADVSGLESLPHPNAQRKVYVCATAHMQPARHQSEVTANNRSGENLIMSSTSPVLTWTNVRCNILRSHNNAMCVIS
ncbi:hypothetical protein ANN_00355 [Periplaneta americana]|uniref:Uncharacterized protein n=1 Tax=Periplaneta americana TaxID=6978 RepID=A0ABQ8TQJ2_PERAM|nr:hypothetical protein ANN_00355 [Periplaneta americana]